jgi:hypothetical protein
VEIVVVQPIRRKDNRQVVKAFWDIADPKRTASRSRDVLAIEARRGAI